MVVLRNTVCRMALVGLLISQVSMAAEETPMPSEAIMESAKAEATKLVNGIKNASTEFAEDMGWLEKSRDKALEQAAKVEAAAALSVDLDINVPEYDFSSPVQASSAHHDITVLVSWAMGEPSLKETLYLAATCRAKYPDITSIRVAFRGVNKDEKLGEFVRKQKRFLSKLLEDEELVSFFPELVIDFQVFQDHSPDGQVPMVVDNSEVRPGFNNACVVIDGLLEESAGSTIIASEEDIKERMRRETMAIDWTNKKEQIQSRYYNNMQWAGLQKAIEYRERDIDMRVKVTADIRAPDGSLIAEKGQLLNPIGEAGFTPILLIADLRRPDEKEWLKSQLNGISGRSAIVILAGIPVQTAKYIGELEQELATPIYFLQSQLKERLMLEYTPSRVETSPAIPSNLRVTEYALSRGEI